MGTLMQKRKKKALLNPQQSKFLSWYLDPKSPIRGNALQSALKAGYSQEYAESITVKGLTWLAENVGRDEMLVKAERNLDEFLDLETTVISQSGYKKTNTEILKVKADVTKFVASTVGKYAAKETLQTVPHQTIINLIVPHGATSDKLSAVVETVRSVSIPDGQ